MWQTCSFRATISQKSIYLIRHYAISGFGWTYLYISIQNQLWVNSYSFQQLKVLVGTNTKFNWLFYIICRKLKLILPHGTRQHNVMNFGRKVCKITRVDKSYYHIPNSSIKTITCLLRKVLTYCMYHSVRVRI